MESCLAIHHDRTYPTNIARSPVRAFHCDPPKLPTAPLPSESISGPCGQTSFHIGGNLDALTFSLIYPRSGQKQASAPCILVQLPSH